MIDRLIEGIAQTLDEYYKGAYPIRNRAIEQQKDGARDRFFITLLEVTPTEYLQHRGRYRFAFDVRFHPRPDSSAPLEAIAWQVSELLRMIQPRDMTARRGLNRSSTIVDGVVHVLVDYDIWVDRAEEKTLVQQLKQYKGVKNAQ